ncbi:MAG TPA: GNAT family N-acetyltransferase [Gammaproteobacteria bacterium]
MTAEDIVIEHDERGSRFVARVAGGEAYLTYVRLGPRTLDYYSTFVPESLRGRGIASALVRHALAYAKDRRLKIVPTCPFVAHVVQQDRSFDDLVVVDKSVEKGRSPTG